MSKYESISALIEKRIRLGDYALKDIPPEERLASEAGVSRMTARRAVLRLVEKGVLVRQANGRVAVNRDQFEGNNETQLALLAPAYVTPEYQRWQMSAERVAQKMNVRLRKVEFVHWDDPTILETFDRVEGVFLLTGTDPVPPEVVQKLAGHRTPMVVLDSNWSRFGVRSIDLMPPNQIHCLLDHLAQLGHRRIACLSTQPCDDVMQERIRQWSLWCDDRGCAGRLINDPVQTYGDAMAKAYDVMTKFLQVRQPDFTAILSTTSAAAVGALRALHDADLRIGQEVSICAVNDEGLGRYMHPTLTSTQMADPDPFLAVGFEWMLKKGNWPGDPLLQPKSVSLFIGESTGNCPQSETG